MTYYHSYSFQARPHYITWENLSDLIPIILISSSASLRIVSSSWGLHSYEISKLNLSYHEWKERLEEQCVYEIPLYYCFFNCDSTSLLQLKSHEPCIKERLDWNIKELQLKSHEPCIKEDWIGTLKNLPTSVYFRASPWLITPTLVSRARRSVWHRDE